MRNPYAWAATRLTVCAVLATSIAAPARAWADYVAASASFGGNIDAELDAGVLLRPGFGLRIGGYGFRALSADGQTRWTDCRMDGFGAFGTLDIGPILFTEVGLDVYQSTGRAFAESGMERLDISLLGAVGVRPFPSSIVRPFVQLGLGAALVDVTSNARADYSEVFPMGFVGTGAEVAVGDNVRLGANLRLFLLATVGHDETTEPSAAAAAAAARAGTYKQIEHAELTTLEPGMAGQVQFWARWDF